MVDTSGDMTWWIDIANGHYVSTRRTRHYGKTWRENMMGRHGGRTWWQDIMETTGWQDMMELHDGSDIVAGSDGDDMST